MSKDTCDRCVHCTHVSTDELGDEYYFCEIDGEYISETFALNVTLECEAFVENMDDNETEKQ